MIHAVIRAVATESARSQCDGEQRLCMLPACRVRFVDTSIAAELKRVVNAHNTGRHLLLLLQPNQLHLHHQPPPQVSLVYSGH